MIFALPKLKTTVFTMFLAFGSKNRGIYSVFCFGPSKNIGIYPVSTLLHYIVSVCKNNKDTVFYGVFASCAQPEIVKN